MFFEKTGGIKFIFNNKSLLWVLVFLLVFNSVKADDEPRVVINEVAWMGTTENYHHEWIELKNTSSEDVDLEGWTLESRDGGIYNNEGKTEEEDEINKIILSGEIKSGKFYLLERTDDKTVEDVDANLIFTGNINDTKESLILKNKEGDVINKVEADPDWPAGKKKKPKKTMERTKDGKWQDSFIEGGTPGEKNSEKEDEEDDGDEGNEGDEGDEEDEDDNEGETEEDEKEDEGEESGGDDEDQKDEEMSKCNLEERAGLDKILINEILPDPSEGGEWIELYNFGEEDVLLEDCFLVDENLYKKKLEEYSSFKKDQKIKLGEYKVIFNQTKNEIDKNFSMNNDGEEVYFLDQNGDELDSVFFEDKAEKGYSYALNFKGDWEWVEPSFGSINVFPSPKIYSEKVEMTELMPNPEGVDKNKEWVELFNGDLLEIDLKDWYLVNQSDRKFKLDGLKIKPQERLKVEIKNSSFSIKNSDGWIELRNPNDKKVDKVVYLEKAKMNTSYNKKSNNQWEWSIFITPGQENKFNNLPSYKVDLPDKIYENVKAFFKIEKIEDKDGESLKFRWDFGNGKKSYLKETSHKFDKRGRYTIQTRVSDLSADVFKYFNIEVQKFPDFDLRIVKLLPNPEGSDSDNEKIWILNKEKKAVNLKGWSITTGSSMSKLTNHYFKEDFKIKAGDVEEVDREDCPFSLLNKKGRVVLKAPNGEVVDKVKYQKDKIEEDEIYYLEDDEWFWQLPIKEVEQQPKSLKTVVLGKEDQSPKKDLVRLILDENKYYGSKKLVYFNNWLFVQSQNYFFEFIFPESLVERVKMTI